MSRGVAMTCLTALSVSLSGGTSLAQLVATAVGTELQVNSHTPDTQVYPEVGIDGSGRFVVVWESNVQDGSLTGIFARRYDSTGAALATEFQVNTHTAGTQRFPVVDMNGNGAFVVAWNSENQDGFGYGVFARRFDAAGVAQAFEFQVNAVTTGTEARPSVGLEENGDFVVSYNMERGGSYYDVFGRRFASTGSPIAVEFQVNTYTTDSQDGSAVGVDADGDFVIVWVSEQDPGYGVFAQRFNSAGTKLGVELHVNSTTSGFQAQASVELDADGDFVVVWTSANLDGAALGIAAQRFNSAGVPLGTELVVNHYATGGQYAPDLAIDASGDFVITWSTNGPSLPGDGSEQAVLMRRFTASGLPLHADTRVNTSATGTQYVSNVAADPDGDFVVAWMSEHGSAPFDIFLQRYGVQPLLDVDGNGVFEPLTDGLLILRFGFGFTGATLINGVVGAGCTRCDAPSITEYLQSVV